MPMTRYALTDDRALQHVEGGEQRRRAGSLVIMSHRPAAAALYRQSGLSAIERLDLRLLIDRENQRVLGRIDIEADDILNLGGKLRSFDSLKVRMRCGLRPCAAQMRCTLRWLTPAAFAIARQASASSLPEVRPASARPRVRPLPASAVACRRDASRREQPIDAFGHEPRLPTLDRRLAFTGLPPDRHRADPIGAQQHNPSPPNMLLRAVPRADHGFQPVPVGLPPGKAAFSE